MKHGLELACLIAAIALHFPALADDRLEGLKKINREGCIRVIDLEENAPKDAKQVKPYCTCVYEAYFEGFTKAEQEQLFASLAPLPEKLEKSLPVRLKAAQAQCRKKIGF
jgi:hypothetical protein